MQDLPDSCQFLIYRKMLAFVIFAVLFVVVLICTVIYLYPASSSRVTTVPGPEPVDDLEGSLPDIAKFGSLHEFLVDLHDTYGPIASFFYGPRLTISLASPELLSQHLQVFDRPPELYQVLLPLLGDNSILFANGGSARQRLSLYGECFTENALNQFYAPFHKISEDFVRTWDSLAHEEHINLQQYMSAFAIKALSKSLCGPFFDENTNILTLRKSHDSCWGELNRQLMGDLPDEDGDRMKRFQKEKEKIFKTMQSAIDYRQNNSDGQKLFLDCLMKTDLSEEDKMADLVTMFVSAYQPTAMLLTWMVYFLASHQEVQDDLHSELMSVLGSKPNSPQYVNKLKFLQSVIDETLRCSTLTPFSARYQEFETELGGHKIPRNTAVVHALGVTMMNAELFPQPDVYDPARFADENSSTRPKLAFTPFGFAGKRKCPGYNLSLVVVHSLIPCLLRKFKVNLVPGQVVDKTYGLVTAPREDVWVTLSRLD